MGTNRQDRFWGIIGGIFMVGLYLGGFINNDIPTWERNYLQGVQWLLNNASMFYLPIFPLISGILSLNSKKEDMLLSLGEINCMLTFVFMIFAYATDVLEQTWFCLWLGSVVFLIMAIHDTREQKHCSKAGANK